jgi:hypothetical protein
MKAVFKSKQTVEQVHLVAKTLGEKEVTLIQVNPEDVEVLLRKAGNKIGSVHFEKRTDKSLRKMCYRLHVKNPKNANAPKGNNRKGVNKRNKQMTVYDVNKVIRNKAKEIQYDENGKQQRGAWRTVPLENVVRICVDGITYKIEE